MDFSIVLRAGPSSKQGGPGKPLGIARVDSWHNRLHIDIEYADGRHEKFDLQDRDYTPDELPELPPLVVQWFAEEWRSLLLEYCSPTYDDFVPRKI